MMSSNKVVKIIILSLIIFSCNQFFIFSLENSNNNNVTIICPDADFGMPIQNSVINIEIYKNNQLIQTLKYNYEDTFMLIKHFEIIDLNFDGFDDILISAGLTPNRGQQYYVAYLWNERQNEFIFLSGAQDIINMKIDKENKLIYSSYMLNDDRVEYYVYSFCDDKLILKDFIVQQEKKNKLYYTISSSKQLQEYNEINLFWKNIIDLYN